MGIRILIIEDEAEIADFMVRGLREEGYVVEHAADGVDGGHRLQKESWDLVLLDWWLPGADGLTLLRRFRQEGGAAPEINGVSSFFLILPRPAARPRRRRNP
jgi:two-component system copper resistance phosphate regulon response regulator CusR